VGEYRGNRGKSNSGRPAVVALACVGVFVACLPVVTVAVSLPAIQRALHASTAQLAWNQDAFVLPMAALILTAALLGDIHGRRGVYVAGLGLCAAGAVTALCAGSVQVLLIGQALAGAGAAALLPVTLGLISHAVPDHRQRGKYIGIWTTCMMAAMVVGPLVAGPVVTHLGWRWIHVLPLVCALIALAAAARLLPDSRSPHARRTDVPGQVTAAVAIAALVYGVIEGGEAGFSHPASCLTLTLAAVALAAFVVVERRSPSPMLDLTLVRSPGFRAVATHPEVSFASAVTGRANLALPAVPDHRPPARLRDRTAGSAGGGRLRGDHAGPTPGQGPDPLSLSPCRGAGARWGQPVGPVRSRRRSRTSVYEVPRRSTAPATGQTADPPER
jgi:MFS family permease